MKKSSCEKGVYKARGRKATRILAEMGCGGEFESGRDGDLRRRSDLCLPLFPSRVRIISMLFRKVNIFPPPCADLVLFSLLRSHRNQ